MKYRFDNEDYISVLAYKARLAFKLNANKELFFNEYLITVIKEKVYFCNPNMDGCATHFSKVTKLNFLLAEWYRAQPETNAVKIRLKDLTVKDTLIGEKCE